MNPQFRWLVGWSFGWLVGVSYPKTKQVLRQILKVHLLCSSRVSKDSCSISIFNFHVLIDQARNMGIYSMYVHDTLYLHSF